MLLLCGWAAAALATSLTADARAGLLALDPKRIGERQLRELLAQAPAPRVLLFTGSLGADMEFFGAFLQGMGYPARQLRNPTPGRYSYNFRWDGCSCAQSEALVCSIGALVRSEGMAPMLVVHSGGGVTVGRILQRLAADADADAPMLGQVQASVMAFKGYRVAGDPFTALLGFGDYRPAKGAHPLPQVRNVLLPAQVSHVRAFEVDGYAQHLQLRAWIGAHQPGSEARLPEVPGLDLSNLRHAADLWHSLKKHWALQARQWAARAGAGAD